VPKTNLQKLWKEKEQMKKEIEVSDEYLMKDPDRPKNWTCVSWKQFFKEN